MKEGIIWKELVNFVILSTEVLIPGRYLRILIHLYRLAEGDAIRSKLRLPPCFMVQGTDMGHQYVSDPLLHSSHLHK